MTAEVVVVGGGPAGLSAAVQLRQRRRNVLVITNDVRENPLYRAEAVDNYLGCEGLSGGALLERFTAHAMARGADFLSARVLSLMPGAEGGFLLSLGDELAETKAVVLATGVSRGRRYPGESEFLGRGVSYCAVCDGMLYRGKDVVVVGQAHDAPAEANFLSSIGCRVTYLSARPPLGLDAAITAVAADTFEIQGGETGVTGVAAAGRVLPCSGVFLLRETVAPSDLVPGLALDGRYIKTDRAGRTNLPGLFAAGDCTGTPLQVSKAVGEGLIAGLSAAEFLEKL